MSACMQSGTRSLTNADGMKKITHSGSDQVNESQRQVSSFYNMQHFVSKAFSLSRFRKHHLLSSVWPNSCVTFHLPKYENGNKLHIFLLVCQTKLFCKNTRIATPKVDLECAYASRHTTQVLDTVNSSCLTSNPK